MQEEIRLEELVLLYPFITLIGVREHLATLKRGDALEPIEVLRCLHDGRVYLDDGAHRCFVYHVYQQRSSVIAEVNLCTRQNRMYGFSDDTCCIKELHGPKRFTIRDFRLETPVETMMLHAAALFKA